MKLYLQVHKLVNPVRKKAIKSIKYFYIYCMQIRPTREDSVKQ